MAARTLSRLTGMSGGDPVVASAIDVVKVLSYLSIIKIILSLIKHTNYVNLTRNVSRALFERTEFSPWQFQEKHALSVFIR